jgi:hypothetical protein
MPRSTPFAGERNGAGRVCPTPVPITRVAPGGVSLNHAVRVSGTRRTGATVRRAPLARAA